jgi:formylglycine-generating enzyme required for sulfatase activity
MADIFISYAREDWEKARTLAAVLQAKGWSVFWDRELRPGQRFHREIERQLEIARCVVVLWSRAALESDWVRDEADEGKSRDILVPARLDDCRPPIGFRGFHFAELSGWSGESVAAVIERLVADIAILIGEPAAQAFEAVAEEPAPKPTKKPAAQAKPVPPASKPVPAQPKPPPHPKDGIYIGVDPRGLPDLAVFKDVDAPWCPAMVIIPAGSFLMGSPPDEKERSSNEGPRHQVTISRRFALGRTAVTFDEYDPFCAETGQEKPGDAGWGRGSRPVINVSWRDATAYCEWLSGQIGQLYRLPSEAEWEYACRAGTTTPFSFGGTITPEQVNYDGTYPYASGTKGLHRKQTVPVMSLPANPWGLHEMHGNVWEWCLDGRRKYSKAAVTDPVGPTEAGAYRVIRGGSWYGSARSVRSAYRYALDPGYRLNYFGIRCARVQGS